MADSVLAIKDGFDFQAQHFWLKACLMYANPDIKYVAWEDGSVRGFDDVGVCFEPARLTSSGQEISWEYYQVKFHVTHNDAFTTGALIDPSFIGATAQSLLQKLYNRYRADPEHYSQSLFTIVNTWTLDKNDPISRLLDNDGALIISKLFDGSTDRSRNGTVRKLWRDHLKIQDEELKIILQQLRIHHGAIAGERLIGELNLALKSVGLKNISTSTRTNPYEALITQLQREKKIQLDRIQLRDALKREDLWVTTSTDDVPSQKLVGIRTFQRGTDSISFETRSHLCLLHHFGGRYVLNRSLWNSHILPELSLFTEDYIKQELPISLHLDTHASVAFAAGYFADVKSGADIGVVQKTANGRIVFRPTLPMKPSGEVLWDFSVSGSKAETQDVVICISVTHDIAGDVNRYVGTTLPDVSHIFNATIKPKPCGTAIKDGNHIVEAIDDCIAEYRRWVSERARPNRVHLFLAAPNSFSFLLGQRSKILGRITLYEFDFENMVSGTYEPAINLPT